MNNLTKKFLLGLVVAAFAAFLLLEWSACDYCRQQLGVARFLSGSPSMTEIQNKYGKYFSYSRNYSGTDSLVMEGWSLPPWHSHESILVIDVRSLRIYIEVIDGKAHRFWIGTS
jgi:hypothetical protein